MDKKEPPYANDGSLTYYRGKRAFVKDDLDFRYQLTLHSKSYILTIT